MARPDKVKHTPARMYKRIANPYKKHRKGGGWGGVSPPEGRIEAFKSALMTRRSWLGSRGWMPYKNYLASDAKVQRSYNPAILMWHWRNHRIWIDKREIERQALAAHHRYLARQASYEADVDGTFARMRENKNPITDAELENARRWMKDDMGWV